MHYSNVKLIDPVSKLPVRASFRYLEDGQKVKREFMMQAQGRPVALPVRSNNDVDMLFI